MPEIGNRDAKTDTDNTGGTYVDSADCKEPNPVQIRRTVNELPPVAPKKTG